jgi:adenylate cyclase
LSSNNENPKNRKSQSDKLARQKSKRSLREAQGLAFLLVGAVSTLLVGSLIIASLADLVRSEISNRLESSVGLIASQISAGSHSRIRNRADESGEAYLGIVKELRRSKQLLSDVRFVYTLRQGSDGKIRFVVDAEPNADTKSHVGDVYSSPSAAMLQAFRPPYRIQIEPEVTTDKWGAWISGFAPILDTDGKVEAVVGIDMAADRIRSIQFSYFIRVILGSLMLSSVIGALGYLIAGRLSAPMRAVSADLDRIRKLNFKGSPIGESAIREIAELSAALRRMKRGLRSFRRYVPSEVVTQLIEQDKEAELGGEKRVLTIFFSDIADFTRVCESMRPERLSKFLTVYFEVVTKTVVKHGGTVDKFMGDAVMAFWNAPRTERDHAFRALAAAADIQQQFDVLQDDFNKRGWPDFKVRVGMATGLALVGNIGFSERLSYTVLGDAVNLASRLESLNKYYGTRILISGATAKRISDRISVRLIDLVLVQGKIIPTALYVPEGRVDSKDQTRSTRLQYYEDGFRLYRKKNFADALAFFDRYLALSPEDGPARVLRQRCVDYLDSPPDSNWQGAFRLDLK